MSKLKTKVKSKFYQSIYNHYGKENYDEHRFGQFPERFKNKHTSFKLLKDRVKKLIGFKNAITEKYFNDSYTLIAPYQKGLERVYDALSDRDRETVIDLLAYHMLGYEKVWLSQNNKTYHTKIKEVDSLKNQDDFLESNYRSIKLYKYNLTSLGHDINLYFNTVGIVIDYVIEQYAYKVAGKTLIGAEKDDVVLDLGGCWGDTAHYFASKVGENGKVYSFEFIPENIKLFNKNLALNPKFREVINVVENPVSNTSDVEVFYKDNGPGSIIKDKPFSDQTGSVKTLSVDDFIERNKIDKVDFIKMDIEGTEPLALEGAIHTIKKHRPKLAIANYHGLGDFTNIPNWILDLNLDYEIFIGHYTIHAEETVCFARPK